MVEGSWEWAHPQWLAALVLPVGWLLWLRRPGRAPEQPVGTLWLWLELGSSAAPRGEQHRHRPPGWAWSLALGLVLVALAAAEPRLRPAETRHWTAVLEPGPALLLPLAAGGAGDGVEAGLDAWRRFCAEHGNGGDRWQWFCGHRPLGYTQHGESWPAEDLRRELSRSSADFDWSSLDGPGVLWLRRAAPESTPLHAGFVATGGEPVPGPLGPRGAGHPTGGDPRAQLHFDGRDLVPADPAGDAVLLSGPCPAELERALAAWTASRGLELVRAPQSPPGPLWLRVEVRRAGAELAAEEWLELRPDRALPVQVEPGQLTVLGGAWPEPADGPAFALAAARLFDRAALAPVERAALTARLSAGPPSVAPGSEPPRRGSEPLSSGWPLAALGALAFAVAARLHSS